MKYIRVLKSITRKSKILLAILIPFILFLAIDFASFFTMKSLAYSTSCPKEIADKPECLDFLEKERAKINKDKANAQQELNQQQYQQLSLLEKISYIDSQISSIEKEIDLLELDIQTKSVEIKILGSEINTLQNNLSTMSQEINRLQNSVKKRITLSYKYSFMTPIEMLLEADNFDTLLRKIKYISETRKKDKTLISEMATKTNSLKIEEDELTKKKNSIEEKRFEMEEEKTAQFNLRKDLSNQRSERSVLYAQSLKRQAELIAKIESAEKARGAVDSAIFEYIAKSQNKFINMGTVTKGQPIGRMGNKGCSYGAHLHFSISTTSYSDGYGNINPWNGSLRKGPDYWTVSNGRTYYYVRSGTLQVPLAGTVVLSGSTLDNPNGFHQNMAIDMFSLSGEGAIVYAANSGRIELLPDDSCGNPYVRIFHSNGTKTSYLHMNEFFLAR